MTMFKLSDNKWLCEIVIKTNSKYPNPPHKHRDLIIAWANGAEIEFWSEIFGKWESIRSSPCWSDDYQYRIKPKKSEKDLEIESIQKQMDELKQRLDGLKGDK